MDSSSWRLLEIQRWWCSGLIWWQRSMLESFVGIVQWTTLLLVLMSLMGLLIHPLWKQWPEWSDIFGARCWCTQMCNSFRLFEVIVNLHKQNLCAYSSILRDIKTRSTLFQDVIFKHEGRCSNNEAHAIAKSVCNIMPGRYVWLLQWPEILHVPQNIMTV